MKCMDWSNSPLIEVDAERVSGTPVLVGTRVPADATVENVDSFVRIDGLSLEKAIKATAECFPGAGIDRIAALLQYRAIHSLRENTAG